jgi:hypothetical protein
MRRLVYILLLGLIMGGVMLSPVFASEIIRPFKISIHTSTQDPRSNEFEIIAVVNSLTKNDRVTITWSLPSGLEPVEEDSLVKHLSINIGDNYFPIKVVPKSGFASYVNFTIESFGSTTRTLYNQRAYIEVLDTLEFYPQTDYYITLDRYYNYQNIVWIIFWVFFSFAVLFSISAYISEKAFPQEEKSKIPRNSKIINELERRRLEENIPFSQPS